MYVEISPRQSGKTTRLVDAVVSFLQNNFSDDLRIVICAINLYSIKHIKRLVRNKIANDLGSVLPMDYSKESILRTVDNLYMNKIISMTSRTNLRDHDEPSYWFFDEFAYLPPNKILHPIHGNILENAYYSTTPPTGDERTINMLVNHCQNNNFDIHHINPWAEHNILEQGGLDEYTREVVLGDWVRYMESKNLIKGLKENLIRKEIRKHRFKNW